MCTTLRYIHRVELPCDEDKTRTFKEKVYWVAYGDSVPDFLGIDEDTHGEQYVDPCDVRKLINYSDILELTPSDQEDRYHQLLFNDLMSKLDGIASDTPSGEWFFRCLGDD